jgi:hypothetical protein
MPSPYHLGICAPAARGVNQLDALMQSQIPGHHRFATGAAYIHRYRIHVLQ